LDRWALAGRSRKRSCAGLSRASHAAQAVWRRRSSLTGCSMEEGVFDLQRFVTAQASVFETAIAELVDK
jgi:hypothetical protein